MLVLWVFQDFFYGIFVVGFDGKRTFTISFKQVNVGNLYMKHSELRSDPQKTIARGHDQICFAIHKK